MKLILHALLLGVLILILLMSACTLPAQTPPTPIGTILSTGQVTPTATATPTKTPGNEPPTAFIPITGMDVVSLQCQFCVNEEAHAVLIMSDQVFFSVADPETGVTCLSAQEVNGRRILLCRGAQQTSFQLDVCVDDSNCLQFPITLQTCPLIPQTGLGTPIVTFTSVAPILLTPINTFIPPEETDEPSAPRPTRTPRVTPPSASTTVPPSTTEPTSPPTEEPTEPPSTEEPTEPPETEAPTEPSTEIDES